MLLTVGSIAAATALGMPRPVATPSVPSVDSPHIGGGRVRWALEKVLQEAAERTHCRISCLVPHGTVYVPQPTSEADVVVCIWSTPVKTAETKIRSLFGYDFPKTGTSDAFQPVPGLQTCMDENGQAYAQVLPAAAGNPAYVFVLFDLVHAEFDGLTDLMREVFHHVIPAALPPLVAAAEVVHGDASEFFPVLPAPLDLPSAPLEVRQESGRQYRWQHERGAARDAAVVAATDPFEPVIALHVDAVRESRERLAATA
ncbi:hypothetical protein HY480_02540, partial [Candidatus Uhrbacteria bacterium]|nr:hypothetical protein [Candidatus Uhrbacteria bacterium]